MSWLESGDLPDYTQAHEVRIYTQRLNLLIQNPESIPIYTGDTGNTVFHKWSQTNFSGLAYIEDRDNIRGRFLRYMFDVEFTTPVASSDLDNVYLWILLDGFDFQLRLTWIAALNGMIHITKATTSAWVFPDVLSREGGLTAVQFDSSGNIQRVIGIWEVQHEFENSWEIRFANYSSSSVNATIRYEVSYYI